MRTGTAVWIALIVLPIGSVFVVSENAEAAVSNRSLERSISRLDDDPVKNVEIPILFGVSLNDLFPNFGDPRDGGTRTHEGLDMLAPLGTPVVSPTDAVVTRTGNGSSAGLSVYTANPGGETFAYLHLDEIADIERGDVLEAGDLIGFVGDTGNTNGVSHLHFEIRDGRTATDPYPRLTREFSLEDKLEYLDEILDDVRNDDKLADFLFETYKSVFFQAKSEDIDLPGLIENLLEEELEEIQENVAAQDLELGNEGSDVVWLQNFLISINAGPVAQRLGNTGATGYFGPLTKAALIEYQEQTGIEPATGYFGAVTRARVTGNTQVSGPSQTPPQNELTQLTEILTALRSLLRQVPNAVDYDLAEGDSGSDVGLVQTFLIFESSGPEAKALTEATATGYFGPLTKAALIEYQKKESLNTTGMYDASTRSAITMS